MQLLLDTHTILWWLSDANKLSKRAFSLIENGENDIYLSSVSVWEIRIKEQLGKLEAPKNLLAKIEEQDIIPLEIQWYHADAVRALPNVHKDPFDRMLVAQSNLEKLPLLSKDSIFKNYKVKSIW